MTNKLMKIFAAFVTFIMALIFDFLFGRAIVITFLAEQIPEFSEAYLYLCLGLLGLVGGVVAAGFGVEALTGDQGPALSRPKRKMNSLGSTVAPGAKIGLKNIVAIFYVISFILLGLLAIIVWVLKSDLTPDLIKNLACMSFGLFLAIAQSYFKD
jgi:hypothetical protein